LFCALVTQTKGMNNKAKISMAYSN